VPEGGDEVQTMKAGLMEIADIFVINKSDRPDAALFEKNLRSMLAPAFNNREQQIPVVKTVATEKKGIDELMKAIKNYHPSKNEQRHIALLTEKAWHLLVQKKMEGFNKSQLQKLIQEEYKSEAFNLYSLIDKLLIS
jgi:LAO/AO transport system kinase